MNETTQEHRENMAAVAFCVMVTVVSVVLLAGVN